MVEAVGLSFHLSQLPTRCPTGKSAASRRRIPSGQVERVSRPHRASALQHVATATKIPYMEERERKISWQGRWRTREDRNSEFAETPARFADYKWVLVRGLLLARDGRR
jgi:hypothetical protein